MRGAKLAVFFSCACAGVFCAFVATPSAVADDGAPPPTEPPPVVADPPPPPPVTVQPKPKVKARAKAKGPKKIADGVTIGGLPVSGLTRAEARREVKRRFERPLPLVVSKSRRVKALPGQLGATLRLDKALSLALRVREGFRVPLTVDVNRGKLDRFLGRLGRDTEREPVDSRMFLRKLVPFATKSHPGRALKVVVASRDVVRALKTHARDPVPLRFRETKPSVTEDDFGKTIVIRRESKKLFLYDGVKLKRVIGVATGQSSYPTPIGRFEITSKQANPWWYPPQGSSWAEGKEPVPPGPGNPLGTRWLGISAPYIGLHGTPDAASIGYSASHGCVRMLISDAEWLFDQVTLGTTVFIVRA
jgi:lipoprotein-anchoring transpeptidase ErfK/SrfK